MTEQSHQPSLVPPRPPQGRTRTVVLCFTLLVSGLIAGISFVVAVVGFSNLGDGPGYEYIVPGNMFFWGLVVMLLTGGLSLACFIALLVFAEFPSKRSRRDKPQGPVERISGEAKE